MTWDAGTITDAAPWAALSTKIKALCGDAGAENWEFLENVPAGTGIGQSGSASYALDVFVCRGTNSRPNDVGYVNKLSASDTNAGASTSIVFAGVSALAANKVFTVVVTSTKATACNDPSSVVLDGADAPTFTMISSKIGGDATGIVKVSVWMGKSGADAPAGTNLTVTWAAAQTSSCVSLDEWTGLDDTLAVTGIDASGATQICVQAGTASGTNQTAQPVTVGALLNAGSCLFMMNTQTASTGTYTPPTGWISSAVTKTVATPASCLRTYLRPDAESVTGSATLSSATSETSWAAITLELQRSTLATAYGTLSDASRDWFFVIEIPAVDGAVNSSIGAFERYDPAAGMKVFSSPCPTSGVGNPGGTGYWKITGWYSYTDVAYLNRTNLAFQALNTSGFNYWIKMTRNALVFATRVGANELMTGAQLVDTFVANVTDAVPLVTCKMLGTAGQTNTFASLPGVATVSGSSTLSWTAVVQGWTQALRQANTYNLANAYDLWQDSKIHVGRLFVWHGDGTTATDAASYGFARGLYKTDFLAVSNAGGTVNLGDTITIDGNTWTVIGYGYFGSIGSQNLVLLTRAT
jgi:hypothetical protein